MALQCTASGDATHYGRQIDPPADKGRILLVEDDYDIRESLRELLEVEGFHVDTAINGLEALEKLAHIERPCVVLLDLMMPVMDGWETMRQLKQDVMLASIPVVVVSAAERTRPPEAARFIKKPYSLDSLLDTVNEFCSSHQPS